MRKRVALLTSGWAIDFVMKLLDGMNFACRKNDIDLYVFSSYKFYEPNGEENTTGFAIYDLIDYKKFDGVVITPNIFNDRAVVERECKRILKAKIPAVSISEPLDNFHYICSYNHNVYRELVSHLIESHNVQDFAYIGGPDNNDGAESNFNAFKEALENHNISLNPDNIYLHGDWSEKFAYEQAKKIFSKEKLPQAIVCINDAAVVAVSKLAVEKGIKIPDEVKVVGFDNIDIAQKIIPSISTVDMNAEEMGIAAIDLILKNPKEPVVKNINAKMILSQSCGCLKKITSEQMLYSIEYAKKIDDCQRFTSQLRHMEDVFIKYKDVKDLCSNLQIYFQNRHQYEGNNFAILLKDEVLKTLHFEKTENEKSVTYGNKMKVIVNIKDGMPSTLETIPTGKLLPSSMQDNQPAMYLFMPIFNQKFVHGYYVSKNSVVLMENKNGYNWTRNFGTSIEKFRQTSIYRNVSKQLEVLSTQDALSGVLNRTGMEKYGEELFDDNNKNGKNTHILFADINDMKIINDAYGHLQGDLAVKTVAEAIRKSIPAKYLGIRYGGDEFVIIGTPKGNKDLCKTITDTLKSLQKSMSLPYKITVSVGEKVFKPKEKIKLLDAIQEVDEIMYIAKEAYHKKNR